MTISSKYGKCEGCELRLQTTLRSARSIGHRTQRAAKLLIILVVLRKGYFGISCKHLLLLPYQDYRQLV